MDFKTRTRLQTSFGEYAALRAELAKFGLDREERRQLNQRLRNVRRELTC